VFEEILKKGIAPTCFISKVSLKGVYQKLRMVVAVSNERCGGIILLTLRIRKADRCARFL
jgi:hypothetical protein